MLRIAVVSFLLLAQVAARDTPITKVLELLESLQATVEADGKEEQKTYDKFACWCEETTARKAAAIDQAKDTITQTSQDILRLTAKIAELGQVLKKLEKDIAANEEGRKEAIAIREKEVSDYQEGKMESENCIQALESAINVLQGAGTKKALETLQQAKLLSAAATVKDIVLPREKAIADVIPSDDLQKVRAFVDEPEKFVGKGDFSTAQFASQVSSGNPFGDYAPASTQIVGILKGMYDAFHADIEKANAEEAEKQQVYEDLHKTTLQEHATLTQTLEMKTMDEAESEKALSDAKVLREDTEVQLDKDQKFFAETKASCKGTAMDWAERTRLRTEELSSIRKAIDILSSSEASATFESSMKSPGGEEEKKPASFLQLSSQDAEKEEHVHHAAYLRLKAVATRYHSLRLAKLAAEVRTSGHFDQVIVMIDKMIANLRKEEASDIRGRDLCQQQENANKNKQDDHEYDIKKTGEHIERLNAKKGQLEGSVEEAQAALDDTNTTAAEMLETRNSETEDFRRGQKDDADAAALISEAIQALKGFYSSNKLPLELLQREPEYTKDPDKAPEAFGSSYGGRKTQATGVIGLLELIKEDILNEMKVAQEEETAAQDEYVKQRNELAKLRAAQKIKKNTLDGEHADVLEDVSEAEGDKAQSEDDLSAAKDEQKAMGLECDWVETSFDKRMEQRKNELDGLMQAKAILAGAPAPEPGFLQLRA